LVALPAFAGLNEADYGRNAGRIAARDRLNEQMTAVTRQLNSADLIAACQAIGVPVSPVSTMADVSIDPLIAPHLVHARDPRTGTQIAIAPPPLASDYLRDREMNLAFPPRLGEHNEAILGALGCDTADLHTRGVV
jgi:formyl-CoA transferase